MKRQSVGFTIVELLIVIVVIAVLAAITIVAYNGIQSRAKASEASTALAQAKKKLELYKVDNGSYPTSGNLASAGVNDGDVTFQYTSNGTTFCITGTVDTVSYKASESTSPSAGGCAGHGVGGVAAITNVSINPSAESSLTNYAGPNGATLSSSTTQAKYGATSILSTLPTASGGYVGVHTSSGYAIPTNFKASTTYTYSAWVYVPSSTVDVRLSSQGTGIGTNTCNSTGTSATSAKDTWVRLSCQFTTLASGTIALYILNITASTTGMQFYTDGVMFTEGSTLYNYSDGNSASWIWNGTTNNSTSTGPPQ